MLIPSSLLIALGAGLAVRQGAAWRRERDVARRLPLSPDGIVVGGEPFEIAGAPGAAAAREGVLLLHGFGDTPQALRGLGEHLAARGYTVRAPLLPGHGRSLRRFARSRAEQWIAAARAELDALRARTGAVHVVGLSMGGALGTLVAADEGRRDAVRSLVLLAPYLDMPRPLRRLAVSHRLLSLAMPYAAGRGERSIHDPKEAARSLAYGFVTPRLLHELLVVTTRAWDALADVAVPTLYVQSLVDNRLTPQGAESAFHRLGSPDKRLEWLDGCGHIITVDYGRDKLFEEVAGWLDQHGIAAGPRVVRVG